MKFAVSINSSHVSGTVLLYFSKRALFEYKTVHPASIGFIYIIQYIYTHIYNNKYNIRWRKGFNINNSNKYY